MTYIINGKKIADELCSIIKNQIISLQSKYNITPCLAVILVGNDKASTIYINNKKKKADLLGIKSIDCHLNENIKEEKLLSIIEEFNNNPSIHAILLQLPLPPHLDTNKILSYINPNKDVDGFHPENAGRLYLGIPKFIPCTPQGCMKLIFDYTTKLSGKKSVIVGRSNIVGKPIAMLLLHKNCTITIAHSNTNNLIEECKTADILITAVGKQNIISAQHVKKNAIVIDVGINRIIDSQGNSKIVGDVDFEAVKDIASAITPVPGGVGPMTIAYLMYNTYLSACMSNNIPIYYDDKNFIFINN